MASANSPLVLSDTDKPLLGKGSKAIEALTKVILDKRWLESFGLLCLVQVSSCFLQVAKIYEFSIPLLDP